MPLTYDAGFIRAADPRVVLRRRLQFWPLRAVSHLHFPGHSNSFFAADIMRINRGIVVASIVIVVCGGGIAQAQNRDKQVDTAVDQIKQEAAKGGVTQEIVKKRVQLVPKVY